MMQHRRGDPPIAINCCNLQRYFTWQLSQPP